MTVTCQSVSAVCMWAYSCLGEKEAWLGWLWKNVAIFKSPGDPTWKVCTSSSPPQKKSNYATIIKDYIADKIVDTTKISAIFLTAAETQWIILMYKILEYTNLTWQQYVFVKRVRGKWQKMILTAELISVVTSNDKWTLLSTRQPTVCVHLTNFTENFSHQKF